MQQVLFRLPFDFPLYGFGAMLFVAFFVVVVWGVRRLPKVGLPQERVQDMAMVLFFSGLLGARILYMIQYYDQFPDKSLLGLLTAFFSIWEGGIVFYGSVFGGVLGYFIFRHFVIRKRGINGWQLADAVAPLMAIGLAVGRIGCFLNGCCWGQVACPECQPVPLTAELGRYDVEIARFPLLSAHARKQLVQPPGRDARLPQDHGLQTTTGFAIATGDPAADPRAILRIEPGSDAERAGLLAGDVIVRVNDRPNYIVLAFSGPAATVTQTRDRLASSGGTVLHEGEPDAGTRSVEIGFESRSTAMTGQAMVLGLKAVGVHATIHDTLGDLARDWPRGDKKLELVVERAGEQVPITYTPRTVTLFPTQMYETLSMVLLTILLLAFQPFRRHDGQVMVVCMLGYALHRFLNEAIRIEPTYAMGLTLSQWISIGIFAAGILLELYLRWTQPRLPPGPLPLGFRITPTPT